MTTPIPGITKSDSTGELIAITAFCDDGTVGGITKQTLIENACATHPMVAQFDYDSGPGKSAFETGTRLEHWQTAGSGTCRYDLKVSPHEI